MSKKEKLLKKLLDEQSSMTWQELSSLLTSLGYKKLEGDGSRVKFDNGKPTDLIIMHKPHPQKEVKKYVLKQIVQLVTERRVI